MIDDRHRDLINAAIDNDPDNQLDDAGRAELAEVLEQSDDARKLHGDLERLSEFLDSLPDEEPPAGLRQSLLNQIPAPGDKASASEKTPDTAIVLEWFPLASRYALARYAIAFVAGLLVTVLGYEYAADGVSGGSAADLVGSMVNTHQIPANTVANSEILDLDQVSGEVTLHRNNGLLIVEFNLDSPAPVELTMDLAGGHFGFDGFAQLDGQTDSKLQSVQVVHGVLRVTQEGQNRFAVLLHPVVEADSESDSGAGVDSGDMSAGDAPGSVVITFYAGGRQIHESVLESPR